MFSQYLDYGWALCAIRPGTKAPIGTDWNTRGRALTAAQADAAYGVGLIHEFSGTCAIDIDDYEEAEKWLAERGLSLSELLSAPSALQITSGRPGRAKLLYALASPLPTLKVAPYERGGKKWKALELRCKGGQDILPETVHCETGQPYQWVGEPLLGVPPLPSQLQALWEALAAPAAKRAEVAASGAAPAGRTMADESIAALLEHMQTRDPDQYDDWIEIGQRIHQSSNGQSFYLWDNWSQKSEKYNEPDKTTGLVGRAHLMSKWTSFRAAGGRGMEGLLAERVAAADEFPVEESVDEFTGSEDDNTPAGVAQRILQPRLILLTGQGRFFFKRHEPAIPGLDQHGEVLLPSDETVNKLFTRHMPEMVNPKTGARTRRAPTDFMKNGVLDPQIAFNMGFHPGAGRMYADSVDGRTYLNRFTPTLIEPLAPKPHEIEAWDWLIARVENDHFRRWLLQFYAFVLKNPGVKIQSAPLLYSRRPGTGKSTLMKLVPKLLFGSRWVRTVSNDEINSRFTGFLADSWFVVLDELKTNGGKMDRVHLANKMKPWITEPELPIERKGENAYSIVNRLQITATSNYDDAVQIDDDDRRWGICEMVGDTMTPAEKVDLFTGFLNTDRAPGVLKHIFQRIDLTGFEPAGEPPRTLGRSAMVSSGLGSWETRIVEAIANAEAPFDRDIVSLTAVQELLRGNVMPSQRRLAGVLKRPPFGMVQIRANGRMYCWRNAKMWELAGGAAAARHMETGERPEGAWDLTVPLAIRLMAGDDDDPTDVSTLLGDVNG